MLIQMSKTYNSRPSELIGIEDEYTSYCFDEACCYIVNMINDGKEPQFEVKEEGKKKSRLPSEIYKQYSV